MPTNVCSRFRAPFGNIIETKFHKIKSAASWTIKQQSDTIKIFRSYNSHKCIRAFGLTHLSLHNSTGAGGDDDGLDLKID